MIITRQVLAEVSRTFLEILEREKATGLPELEILAGKTIPVVGKDRDYLIVNWRPSNANSRALNIEYAIQPAPGEIGGGVPLDVRINQGLEYSQTILKCASIVKGYAPFFQDAFGNIMQSMTLRPVSWDRIREEIERLRDLK